MKRVYTFDESRKRKKAKSTTTRSGRTNIRSIAGGYIGFIGVCAQDEGNEVK